jgi:hypothetical protein
MLDAGTMIQIGTIIAAGGAAWGGVRQAMNGTRESVTEIKSDLKGHIKDANTKHTQVCERLTAVETKLDE